jgi:NADH:ubiquinone oxidoreductase subunit E
MARKKLRPAPKGREVDVHAHEQIVTLLSDEPRTRDLLIEHLHRLQDHFGCLSAAHMTALAYEMRLTPAEIFEVASFYHHFDIIKDGDVVPPQLTVRVCESIACHLAGGEALIEELQQRLGENVRVVAAPCIGRCDAAPAALVGRNSVGNASLDSLEAAVRGGRIEPAVPPYVEYGVYRQNGGYNVLSDCMSGARTFENVMATLDASGLRGLGGAGFPSARKWQFVRNEPAPRFSVMNADEGEPGTFKDRFCLETDPHRVLEGLLIAAWAIDASAVFIYLRDEYAVARTILIREIAALQANPPCALPPIILRRGAGAYICGEETALIESIEGKRGEPRLRPPFPAQNGVFCRPTLLHNVETV